MPPIDWSRVNIADPERALCQIVQQIGGWHPDDPPEDVVNASTGEPTFAPEDCARIEVLLDALSNPYAAMRRAIRLAR